MVTRTFIDKSNTIVRDSELNYGLNPICMLHYGRMVSRFMIHFNIDNLLELVKDGTYPTKSSLRHILKMTNCASLNHKTIGDKLISKDDAEYRNRATSFDLIAFKIPMDWDSGVGFDFEDDFWLKGDACVSDKASSWYYCKSGNSWFKGDSRNTQDGIYDIDFLQSECKKYSDGGKSIIVAHQHFDHGNEDLSMDITNYVNSLLFNNEPNNGLCICFYPTLEDSKLNRSQYVGFFNNNTRTLFEPYVETRNMDTVTDNRMNFHIGSKNRLYFFAYANGEPVQLDEMPTCAINDVEYEVKTNTKGAYYVEVKLSSKDYSSDIILYDVWSNLKFGGEELEDVELQFVTLPPVLSMGVPQVESVSYAASLSGINDDEKLNQGEVRRVKTVFKVPYSKNEYGFPKKAYYRLYVMDGTREVDIIDWDTIEQMDKFNCFTINAKELLPAEYLVDIKATFGSEERIFKKKLRFNVVNNATEFRK